MISKFAQNAIWTMFVEYVHNNKLKVRTEQNEQYLHVMRIREPGKPEEGFVITWDEVDDACKCLRAIFDVMDGWSRKNEEEEYIRNDIATICDITKSMYPCGYNIVPHEHSKFYDNLKFGAVLHARVREIMDRKQNTQHNKFPDIKHVHFSGPVTVVVWDDGTLTRVRCQDDDFLIDYEKGLAMAIAKKVLGTNKTGSDYYDIFKKWLPKRDDSECQR